MIIKRARGHRLYTTEGKKVLDLSMDRGRAVLGHRPNGLSLAIKNVIERGLYARYDNIYEYRLTKELKKRFPGYDYITFLEHEDKVTDFFKTKITDPLFEDSSETKIAYWRPFIETPSSENIVILYPLPGLNTATVLLSREKNELESYSISPVILSGILRSMFDYDVEFNKFNSDDYNVYKEIKDAELKAPYLLFDISDIKYIELIQKAKNSGIMLNDKAKIAVLSTDLSHGEIKKIIETLS